MRELVDWWRNFQSSLKNGFLALDFDVFRPSDKSAKITFGLNMLTYNKAKESVTNPLTRLKKQMKAYNNSSVMVVFMII